MIKVGIIGSGFGTYGLLPAFSELPDAQVVALTAQATPRVQAAVERYHVPALFQDWRQMLAETELDAVAMAITPGGQYEVAQAVLCAGQDLWAEKPVAVTLAQARELTTLADTHQAITAVDFIFPQIPAWQQAQALIAKGELGEIKQLEMNWDFLSHDLKNAVSSWKTDPAQGGGGLAYYFSHVLYYLEWLLGPIAEFRTTFTHSPLSLGGGESGLQLELRFARGTIGTASLNIANLELIQHRLQLTGSSGSLELLNSRDVTKSFELRTTDTGGQTKLWPADELTRLSDEDERVAIVKRLADRFIVACESRQPMEPSLRHGQRVQYLIELIRTQVDSNHWTPVAS